MTRCGSTPTGSTAWVERIRAAGAETVTDVHVNPHAHHREIWIRHPDGYLAVLAEASG